MNKTVPITFAEAAELWIAHLFQQNEGWRRPTRSAGHIRNHVMRYFADHIVGEIRGFDLQRLRWSLATLGDQLAGEVITTLRRFFDFGVGQNWIDPEANPATARVVMLSATSRRIKARMERAFVLAMPSYRQLVHLIECSEGIARTALHLLILAGLRGNEARALRHDHLKCDGEQGWRLDISDAYSTVSPEPLELKPPKTDAGSRFVEVGEELLAHLRDTAAEQKECDHFLQIDGRPMSAEELTLIVRKEQVRLGIGQCVRNPSGGLDYPGTYGIRHFRHAFVALLIFAGCNDRDIAEVVGHSSSVVTLDIYGYLFELFASHAETWSSDVSPDDDVDTEQWEMAA